ncbi:hypothetical protein HOV72_030260, partial [Bacillus albus]
CLLAKSVAAENITWASKPSSRTLQLGEDHPPGICNHAMLRRLLALGQIQWRSKLVNQLCFPGIGVLAKLYGKF